MDLEQLMEFVEDHWKLDRENYSSYPSIGTQEEQTVFAIKHILLHQSKTLGKCADAVERVDHGKPLQRQEIALAAFTFLINAVRLASLMGIAPDTLENMTQIWKAEQRILTERGKAHGS